MTEETARETNRKLRIAALRKAANDFIAAAETHIPGEGQRFIVTELIEEAMDCCEVAIEEERDAD